MPEPSYSFCESVGASSVSLWHIRPLTDKGQKFGGGADTPSLCGREVSWDVNCQITAPWLELATCEKCAEAYRKAKESHV